MRNSGVFLVLLVILLLLSGCTQGRIRDTDQFFLPSEDAKKLGRLQNMDNGLCQDHFSGKVWQINKSKRLKSLTEAHQYVEELRIDGHDDWRLPTLAELYELFLYSDSNGFGDCPMDFEGNYWSSDVDKQGRVGAWELDGDCHPEREYVPKESGFVRAVRP